MRKLIRILEVPFLLLIISSLTFNNGNTLVAILLIMVSVFRIIINKNTDGYGK